MKLSLCKYLTTLLFPTFRYLKSPEVYNIYNVKSEMSHNVIPRFLHYMKGLSVSL